MNRVPSRVVPAVLTGLVAALLVSPPAHAAPTLKPVLDIAVTAGVFPNPPQVEVDDSGTATAVWAAQDGTTLEWSLRASTHPVGGDWSSPVVLNAPAEVIDEQDFDLAVGPGGDAVVAWQLEGSVELVRAVRRAPGGLWSSPATLSAPNDSSRDVAAGVDGAGNALVIWRDTTLDDIVASTSLPGGPWTAGTPFFADGANGAPDVAVAPDGRAAAVWADLDQVSGEIVIRARSRASAQAPFGTTSTLSATTSLAQDPTIDINASGMAVAAWIKAAPDTQHGAVRAARMAPTGAWGTSALVSAVPDTATANDDAEGVEAVIDPAGVATLAWVHEVYDDPQFGVVNVESASAPAGGPWSGVSVLGPVDLYYEPHLSVDAAGNVAAVWARDAVSPQLARRPAGATWQAPVALDPRDVRYGAPAVAPSPGGDVVAVWNATNQGFTTGYVSSRTYDVEGPHLSPVSIPSGTTTGQPTTFSATALDAWSGPGTLAWTFGDGFSASGPSVSHTYAAPGSYTVTVTATDAVGNTRTSSGTITVTTAAPVTPPVFTPPVVSSPVNTPMPVLTRVSLTKKTIHVLGSNAKPRASKVRLTLNTPARVVIVLKRTRKLEGKAITAKLTSTLPAGGSKVKLTSKVGRKKLKPGTYKVTVRASNTTGRTSAKAGKLRLLP